jgi:uncharacterized protein (DUF3084 family)
MKSKKTYSKKIKKKLEQLERENKIFHEELRTRGQYKKENEFGEGGEECMFLQQELDQARREILKFRKEMDGLSAQLNDMASEMVHEQKPNMSELWRLLLYRLILVQK